MAEAIGAASHGRLRLGVGWWSLSGSLTVVEQAGKYTGLTQVRGNCADIVLLHHSQHAGGVKALLDEGGDGALREALVSQQGEELRIH